MATLTNNVFVQGMQKNLCEGGVTGGMNVFQVRDPMGGRGCTKPPTVKFLRYFLYYFFFAISQWSCRKVMVHQACVFPHGGMPGSKSLLGVGGRVYQGVDISGMTWVWHGIPAPSWYLFPLVYPPPRYWHLVMTTKVGDMHPTGMLFVLLINLAKKKLQVIHERTFLLITARQRSLRQGNISTGVCLSIEMATEVGCTHPTGMHSCWSLNFSFWLYLSRQLLTILGSWCAQRNSFVSLFL